MKRLSTQNLQRLSYKNETWHIYILARDAQKYIKIKCNYAFVYISILLKEVS